MILREAIIKVLSGAKGEMHYKEVWDEIKRLKLYTSTAEKPWQSVGSWLYTDRAFRQTSPAHFVLADKRGQRSTRMTLRDAIIEVLSDAAGEMHYKEVWDEIKRRKLYTSTAEKPWQSVGSWLYTDRAFRQTSPARFVSADKPKRRTSSAPPSPGGAPIQGRDEGRNLQFDPDVNAQAEEMAIHYKLFYCLEQSIRHLVANVMASQHGKDWWSLVPDELQRLAKERKQTDEEAPGGPRSKRTIDYATFGELSQLVEKNWETFRNSIRNLKRFKRTMTDLNFLRNPIAHCCLLQGNHPKMLELAAEEWFSMQIAVETGTLD